jgi:RNA polymerase sigma-70 factor, ECF subfamily
MTETQRKDPAPPESTDAGPAPHPDARLVQQLRQGEPEAGHRFVREHYPGIYRYLLFLTGRREAAEDLTQETFLQAWRRLETFDNRGPLRPWLHRIAHREFLQSLRSQRPETSLEEIAETPAPRGGDVTDVELQSVMAALPPEQREAFVLHSLEGYSYQEIARIVDASPSTVKYRLTAARARLQRELGEGDLPYLNDPSMPMRQWSWLPLEQMSTLEARLARGGARRWAVGIGGSTFTPNAQRPTPDAPSEARLEEPMERREFLRNAAVGAAGMMLPAEKEIIDDRLTRKVTLAFKATALSDLCDHLRSTTGIHLVAGPSVADEKVTLFCEKLPLREVMRQLSRPFGYAWLRSGTALGAGGGASGAETVRPNAQRPPPNAPYRYELVQDLRSQLLEEELRNRDRHQALLALEKEIERFRPYLDLSPDEALARSKNAPLAERKLLEQFADLAWGPIQMYFRLSPQDLASIRGGQWLIFSQEPRPGERPLPPEIARGILQSLREERIIRRPDGFGVTTDVTDPRGVPLPAVPEMRAQTKLTITQTELGQFTLEGSAGRFARNGERRELNGFSSKGPLAHGRSLAGTAMENDRVNSRLAHDPALSRRVSVLPAARPAVSVPAEAPALAAAGDGRPTSTDSQMVTTADVLEALHRATGMPIIADYYTRLYRLEAVSVPDQPLFAALNRLTDAMRLRWSKDGDWLQFRSASFYDDRLKEVPNRLLARWTASRKQHGTLTLDDVVEIAGLTDAQLDGAEMAEGARELHGLAEWDLARYRSQRPHLRYLASFTPAQRQAMMSPTGLPFTKMSLAQQQQFMALGLPSEEPLQSLEELAGAVLRVDYTVPGWFQWGDPDQLNLTRWVVPLEPIPRGQRVLRQPVRERTRGAALAAVRRVDPQQLEALAQEWQRQDPRAATPPTDEAHIFPTKLNLTIVYIPGSSNQRSVYVWFRDSDVTFY